MSSLDDVIAQANANISTYDQARDSVEATKSKIDETQQQAAALGVDKLVAGAEQLKRTAEEAQQLIEPAKAKLQELMSQANALKT